MPKENLKWEPYYSHDYVMKKLWRETWNETGKRAKATPCPDFKFSFYGKDRWGETVDPKSAKMKQLLKCGVQLHHLDFNLEPTNE